MKYLFTFLLLTGIASASTLEKKIQALEQELEKMRFQSRTNNRVPSEQKRPKFVAVEEKSHALEIPGNLNTDPQNETVSITENAPEASDDIPMPEPVLSEEYELYEQGRHYLAQQRIDLAKKAFDEVVERFSDTPEAILARFWLGEFLLRTKKYPQASIALGQAYGALKKAQRQKSFSVADFHGEEARLPEILAKLAYALKMINKRQDACITLRQLKRDYKKRPKNLEWYVKKLSKSLKCR